MERELGQTELGQTGRTGLGHEPGELDPAELGWTDLDWAETVLDRARVWADGRERAIERRECGGHVRLSSGGGWRRVRRGIERQNLQTAREGACDFGTRLSFHQTKL